MRAQSKRQVSLRARRLFPTARTIAGVCFELISRAAEVPATGDGALTNAAQIRALTPEEPKGLPVKLRGVLLAKGLGNPTIADESAGVFLEATNSLVRGFHRGDLLEVEGHRGRGEVFRALSCLIFVRHDGFWLRSPELPQTPVLRMFYASLQNKQCAEDCRTECSGHYEPQRQLTICKIK